MKKFSIFLYTAAVLLFSGVTSLWADSALACCGGEWSLSSVITSVWFREETAMKALGRLQRGLSLTRPEGRRYVPPEVSPLCSAV